MARTWATFEREQLARTEGFGVVAGIDEVGRGALAGPVTLGLVVLPDDFAEPVVDSKLLSSAQRADKAAIIKEHAIVCEVMHIEAEYIDEHGIMTAQREAGRRLVELMDPRPDLLLLDGSHDYLQAEVPVQTIVRGDQVSASIAAASIVAKHARDQLMREMENIYPEYGFAMHVGYGTARHRAALMRHGPSPIHRMTFLKNFTFK